MRRSFQRNDGLWITSLDGSGTSQQVFEDPLWSWAWAADGTWVLAQPYAGLMRLDAPGDEPRVLTSLQGTEVVHQYPQVLPDGESVPCVTQVLEVPVEAARVVPDAEQTWFPPPTGP